MRVYLSNVICAEGKDWKVVCDSTNSKFYPLIFYSHAHSDHVPRKVPPSEIISSSTTEMLVKHFASSSKGASFFQDYSLNGTSFVQKPSGHIVGSTALVVNSSEGKLVYTGDVSIRDKGFLKPFRPEKCDTLIIESTFGSPEYEFPDYNQIISETEEEIRKYLEEGFPVVLMGYPLGKAQMLYHSFSDLTDINIMHESNFKINNLLLSRNIKGSISAISYQNAEEENILEGRKSWILYAPLRSGRNEFNTYLRNKYDAKLFAFSGWCTSSNYKFRMDVDHAIPISDHADFSELIEICEKCDPDTIYTIYGNNIKFAAELQRRGFNAYPLSKQTILESYFHKNKTMS
jgi:putative mRNA 3-end processing factor